ncbi:hypothetical protein ACVR05_00580 [Streptococcus caprae]|uniref:Uncharacterized protein n=1 Tax=Streptococcus caprae TaxID=1640501 RepID=A0ABV8CY27_9STRE
MKEILILSATVSQNSNDISLENILSFLAIVVSVCSFIINLYFENKRSKREVATRIFQDIYFKYMQYTIPRSDSNISFNSTSSKLEGITEMTIMLHNLRKKSNSYKFTDKEFHKKVVNYIIELENFYSDSLNTVTDSERYQKFKIDSTKQIEGLYRILNKKLEKGK